MHLVFKVDRMSIRFQNTWLILMDTDNQLELFE